MITLKTWTQIRSGSVRCRCIKKITTPNSFAFWLWPWCSRKEWRRRENNEYVIIDEESSFGELDLPDKIVFILDYPFDFLRSITIPPCEEDKFNKLTCYIFPIPACIFSSYVIFRTLTLEYLIWSLVIGGIMSLIFYFTIKEDSPPKYYIIIQFIGTICSLVWTYIVSAMLIDVLEFLGTMSNLSRTYMGLTVIAVGNALPDALTTIELSKNGLAVMGITGAYAG